MSVLRVVVLAVLVGLMAVAMLWFSGCTTAESRKLDEDQSTVLDCEARHGQLAVGPDGRIACL